MLPRPLNLRIATLALLALGVGLAPLAAAVENLALNRPLLCSDALRPGWTGLTDGVTDSDAAPGCFALGTDNRYPKQIIIDLGAQCLVSKVTLTNSKHGNTRHVSLWLSSDGAQFEKLREYFFPADQVQTLVHSFTARKGRYFKIALHDSWQTGTHGPHCLFLREAQVFGELPAAGTTVAGPEELRLALVQAPLDLTPGVTLFRRYRMGTPGKLRIGVLGDAFAAVTAEQAKPWPEQVPALLEATLGPGQVELLNLASAGQTPTQGARLLQPLRGERPADVIFVAYGFEAALAGADPVELRNSWSALLTEIRSSIPALLVVVTPPPLVGQSGAKAPSTLPLATAQDQLAQEAGLAVLRSAAVLARASDPAACFGAGSRLTAAGHQSLAAAVRTLLLGSAPVAEPPP